MTHLQAAADAVSERARGLMQRQRQLAASLDRGQRAQEPPSGGPQRGVRRQLLAAELARVRLLGVVTAQLARLQPRRGAQADAPPQPPTQEPFPTAGTPAIPALAVEAAVPERYGVLLGNEAVLQPMPDGMLLYRFVAGPGPASAAELAQASLAPRLPPEAAAELTCRVKRMRAAQAAPSSAALAVVAEVTAAAAPVVPRSVRQPGVAAALLQPELPAVAASEALKARECRPESPQAAPAASPAQEDVMRRPSQPGEVAALEGAGSRQKGNVLAAAPPPADASTCSGLLWAVRLRQPHGGRPLMAAQRADCPSAPLRFLLHSRRRLADGHWSVGVLRGAVAGGAPSNGLSACLDPFQPSCCNCVAWH
jgi:hypothetical protein